MPEELKPIDVSKHTVTESGNVIRTDNKETLKNALERITELEKENEQLKEQIEKMKCCLNCTHLNVQHYLCVFSMGDKKYNCKLRLWELAE